MRNLAKSYLLTCACLFALLALTPAAKGGLILTLDSPSITGQPGDVFTLTGTISHSDPSEDLVSIQSFSLTSAVLQLITVDAPNAVPYPAGFSGNILTVQILAGASLGSYPANTFSLTYDSINGRTFSTNAANFAVNVVPEPATFLLTLACLACLAMLRRSHQHRLW